MSFFTFLLTGIGFAAVVLGAGFAFVQGWTAFDEAAERKRKQAERLLELLERIEANTAASRTRNDPEA